MTISKEQYEEIEREILRPAAEVYNLLGGNLTTQSLKKFKEGLASNPKYSQMKKKAEEIFNKIDNYLKAAEKEQQVYKKLIKVKEDMGIIASVI